MRSCGRKASRPLLTTYNPDRGITAEQRELEEWKNKARVLYQEREEIEKTIKERFQKETEHMSHQRRQIEHWKVVVANGTIFNRILLERDAELSIIHSVEPVFYPCFPFFFSLSFSTFFFFYGLGVFWLVCQRGSQPTLDFRMFHLARVSLRIAANVFFGSKKDISCHIPGCEPSNWGGTASRVTLCPLPLEFVTF